MNKHLYDGTDDKTRREEFLKEKMKEFLAKGGKIEKVDPMKPTKEQLKSWTV